MNEGAKDTFGTAAARRVPRIAVLVPCYNEAVTIAKVVDDFRAAAAGCRRCTYTTTTPRTAPVPSRASMGPPYATERRQGKGNVVRQMLRDVDADYYVMVDGDDTYPGRGRTGAARPACGRRGRHERWATACQTARTAKRTTAPSMVSATTSCAWLIKRIYGFEFKDVMTGYRAFNAVFAKTMPVLSPGFEIETELSIHAVDKRWRIAEVPIDYRDRPAGSVSKLSTFSDGTQGAAHHPVAVQGLPPARAVQLAGAAVLRPGPVRRRARGGGVHGRRDWSRSCPSALLAVALVFVGVLCFASGLILDTVVKGTRKEYELEVTRAYGDMRAAEVRGKAESDKGRMGDAPPLLLISTLPQLSIVASKSIQ